MRYNQHKNELEKLADEILAEDTKRRGSGITRYDRNPGKEVLTDDLAVYGETSGVRDIYPSEQPKLVETNVRMRYLNLMLSKLSGRQRECVNLVVVQGLSEREAGRELGIKGGTVSKHLKAAMSKLRADASNDELFQILFPGMVGD